jgi:hypothetical protein
MGRAAAYSLCYVRFAIHGYAHCGILALRLSCLRATIRRNREYPLRLPRRRTDFG